MGDNLQVQTTTQTAKWSIVWCAETNKWEILNDLGKFNSEAPSLDSSFTHQKKWQRCGPILPRDRNKAAMTRIMAKLTKITFSEQVKREDRLVIVAIQMK